MGAASRAYIYVCVYRYYCHMYVHTYMRVISEWGPPRAPTPVGARRGFWPPPGTHAVGSGQLPEPTPWVPHTAPTPWVLASRRNPRRGFWRAAGTHAVGSGQLPEPTPWVLATSRNPRRGFWPAPGTHAVGAQPTPWVLATEPTLFWEFHFPGLCWHTVLGFWCSRSFIRMYTQISCVYTYRCRYVCTCTHTLSPLSCS